MKAQLITKEPYDGLIANSLAVFLIEKKNQSLGSDNKRNWKNPYFSVGVNRELKK